ncbi:MAG: hypothetical protein Q8Q93_18950 [Hydrogenophaga sp.]|nr:hypothetical protein [Hydrogenophaga sp.]
MKLAFDGDADRLAALEMAAGGQGQGAGLLKARLHDVGHWQAWLLDCADDSGEFQRTLPVAALHS